MLRTVCTRHGPGRVDVGCDPRAQRRVAQLAAMRLGVGEEEALVAGQPVDHRRRLAVQRRLIRFVGRGEPGDVGDILAELLLAVEVQAGQRLIGVYIAPPAPRPPPRNARGRPGSTSCAAARRNRKSRRRLSKLWLISWPITRPDRAVVRGRVRRRIEEGLVEDRRREIERVLQRQVDRVDRSAASSTIRPCRPACRSSAAGGGIRRAARGRDCHRRRRHGSRAAIIAPCVGIADRRPPSSATFLRASALVAGAIQSSAIDALVERRDDVLHHALDVGLGRGREKIVGVELADRVAERVVDRADRALVARALLRRARARRCRRRRSAHRRTPWAAPSLIWLMRWKASQSCHASIGSEPTSAASLVIGRRAARR